MKLLDTIISLSYLQNLILTHHFQSSSFSLMMPLSMSATRLVHFPPTAARFSGHLLQFSPLKTLTTISRRKPNLNIFLIRTQPQSAVESQPAEQNAVTESDEAVSVSVSDTRVLVQNVPWTCVAEDLRPLFENYGTVVEIDLSMYNKTKNRGLAFVTMGSHEEARALLETLESAEFQGRVLNTNWAYDKPKPKREKPSSPPKPLPVHNLFVANLPFQARASDLKELFNAGNANVVSAEVIFDNNRRSVGYGFVAFNTKAEAEAAVAAFDGKELMERPIRVARSKRFLRKETKASIESSESQMSAC